MSQSFEQEYFRLEKKKIHDQKSMKKNFDFDNPENNSLDSWSIKEQLSGFCDFAMIFYQT